MMAAARPASPSVRRTACPAPAKTSLPLMTGFSFARFCYELGRMDALKEASRERHNVMEYVAALVQKPAE